MLHINYTFCVVKKFLYIISVVKISCSFLDLEDIFLSKGAFVLFS